MKNQKTVFDFLGQVFLLFGITVMMLLVISFVVGNEVRNYSVMFSLGNEGLSAGTLLQFMLVSFIINGLEFVFFTESWIKVGSERLRTIGMLVSIFIFMSLFVYLFKWFPMNSLVPWLMFFVFFFVSFGVSVVIVAWKEKIENKKMADGLNRIKAQLEEGSNESHH